MTHRCPICNTAYPTLAEAVKCAPKCAARHKAKKKGGGNMTRSV